MSDKTGFTRKEIMIIILTGLLIIAGLMAILVINLSRNNSGPRTIEVTGIVTDTAVDTAVE